MSCMFGLVMGASLTSAQRPDFYTISAPDRKYAAGLDRQHLAALIGNFLPIILYKKTQLRRRPLRGI